MIQVSVIMPIYNGERFIKSAIDSVINQTYKDFEFLIYNDGSTDKTEEIINSFFDKRIKVFSSTENKGVVYGLNFLIDKSQGTFIVRIDSDDIWYKNKLEKQVSLAKNINEPFLIACFARLIDDKGNIFPTKFKQYSEQSDIKKFLPNSNFIIHSSVLISKDVFDIVGKYRDKYLHAEDYDLWLRIMSANIKIINIPETLLDYRVSVYSVNFRFRKQQAINVIRLKFHYWKKLGFKLFYLKELYLNFYYWLFPYWVLKLKLRIINKYRA